MADKYFFVLDGTIKKKLVDMGDGSWAEVVVASPISTPNNHVIIDDAGGVPIVYADVGTKLDNILSAVSGGGEYETVAASQTAQPLGATGVIGDYLAGILVIPATTTPGLVTVLDNAIAIPVFAGGAGSVSNLIPFYVPIGAFSVSGGWKATTGANVSLWAFGNFT